MLKHETFGIFHKFYEKYAKKMLILDMRWNKIWSFFFFLCVIFIIIVEAILYFFNLNRYLLWTTNIVACRWSYTHVCLNKNTVDGQVNVSSHLESSLCVTLHFKMVLFQRIYLWIKGFSVLVLNENPDKHRRICRL